MMRIRAPARICLFGEHQDYLNYPVIAMAISKYIYLEAERITGKKFEIMLPNINETYEILLKDEELEYESKRDYLASGYNQFIKKGIRFNKGYSIKITGDIPINAGAASSSALVMAWLYFLNQISSEPFKTKSNLALEGYNTEIKEFGEAGGMMDHFTSIFGNLLYLDTNQPSPKYLVVNPKLERFVLGNSMEKKETVKDLMKVKKIAIKSFELLKEIMPEFNQYSTNLKKIEPYLPNLEKKYQKKVIGNIINRDITNDAKKLLIDNFPVDFQENSKAKIHFYQHLGDLLNKHHKQLMLNIEISTNKIDSMISKCLKSGGLGGKINGSGFGGTMFALGLPGSEESLKKAIEEAGGEAYSIKMSKGVELY